MNIVMMTNTYKPILGGLEKSVESFSLAYRERGHRVVIVAPEMEGAPAHEEDVVRVPAIQNVRGTPFAVKLPVPGVLDEALGHVRPDIVHAHHPFLMGATALRLAYKHKSPLVFTHHTLFEQNTHYVPGGDLEVLKRFVVELSAGFANLADRVFAPSGSVRAMLEERGVRTPIDVVPTGIDVARFRDGDGAAVRRRAGIPADAFVVGHVGRLAPEKNLEFLARAVALFVRARPRARFLVAGKGPSEDAVRQAFREQGAEERLHFLGVVEGRALVDAYHAMDVFAFASQSETQGMVLVEALAAGVPVVAVDACGVRDAIDDGVNGRLLVSEDERGFAAALAWTDALPAAERRQLSAKALERAEEFSMPRCVDRALAAYAELASRSYDRVEDEESAWARSLRMLKAELDIVKNVAKATKDAVIPRPEDPAARVVP